MKHRIIGALLALLTLAVPGAALAATPYYYAVDSVSALKSFATTAAQAAYYGHVTTAGYYGEDTPGAGSYDWIAGDQSATTKCGSAGNDGTWIKATSIATTAGCWHLNASDPYNVMYWGAKGDHSTNDLPAIQKTVDAACTANGTVTFPAASGYNVAGELKTPCNSLTLDFTTPTIVFEQNDSPFCCTNTSGSTTNTGLIINNLSVATSVASTGAAIKLIDFGSYHLHNVRISDFGQTSGQRFLIGEWLGATASSASYYITIDDGSIATKNAAGSYGIYAPAYGTANYITTAWIRHVNISAPGGDCIYTEGAALYFMANTCQGSVNGIEINGAGGSTGQRNIGFGNYFESLTGTAIKFDGIATMNQFQGGSYGTGFSIVSGGAGNDVNDSCDPHPYSRFPSNTGGSVSLAGCRVFRTQCSSACSITGFTDLEYPILGANYTILCADSNTTFVNSSSLVLKGGANFTCANNNQRLQFMATSTTTAVQVYAPN